MIQCILIFIFGVICYLDPFPSHFPKLVEETAGEVLDVEGPLKQNPGETFTEKTFLRQEKAAGAGAISGGGHVRPPRFAARSKRHICVCNI